MIVHPGADLLIRHRVHRNAGNRVRLCRDFLGTSQDAELDIQCGLGENLQSGVFHQCIVRGSHCAFDGAFCGYDGIVGLACADTS